MNLRKLTPLQWALGISIAVHAVLLTVRLVDPDAFDRAFQDTPLDVILVNAKGHGKPDRAQAIAQASMNGGGEEATGRATSPLAHSATSEQGDTLEEDAKKRIQHLTRQQTMLLAQVREQLAKFPVPDPHQSKPNAEQAAQDERKRLLLKQLAEIERRIKLENAKPRKRFVGPSTREEAYAVYYDRLRRAIENKGTESFPTTSSGRKLYGELTMAVTIDAQGQIVGTEIAESSGSKTLDRRAVAIAQAAAPFGRFPKAMRDQADQIVVISRFRFTRNEQLEATVSAPASTESP